MIEPAMEFSIAISPISASPDFTAAATLRNVSQGSISMFSLPKCLLAAIWWKLASYPCIAILSISNKKIPTVEYGQDCYIAL